MNKHSVKRTRIKVCGMTQQKDVIDAVALGVDAIGFILHADSPRTISRQTAKELRSRIPAFVNVVGVFVDADHDFVERCCDDIGLDTVQLHGLETPEYVSTVSRPYIKALRVKSAQQVVEASKKYQNALGLLLDPFVAGQHGGTGTTLDSDLWPDVDLNVPLILAGGISPSNVTQRISELSPFSIDVNSGVESAPGKKNTELLSALVDQVMAYDSL